MTIQTAYTGELVRLGSGTIDTKLLGVATFWGSRWVEKTDQQAWGRESPYYPSLSEILDRFGGAEAIEGPTTTLVFAKAGQLIALGIPGSLLAFAATSNGDTVLLYGGRAFQGTFVMARDGSLRAIRGWEQQTQVDVYDAYTVDTRRLVSLG